MEGPKLSKEEEEKIAEQVDEALTKNYEEGEAAKKAAAEKEKKETKEETEKEGEPEPKSDYSNFIFQLLLILSGTSLILHFTWTYLLKTYTSTTSLLLTTN